jgi:hypothetical protein
VARKGTRAWPATGPDDGKRLRVGLWGRVVRMPSGVDAPGYLFPRDTRRLYERLIRRGTAQRITRWQAGLPWIDCHFRDEDGLYHTLALNDDSWVRVGAPWWWRHRQAAKTRRTRTKPRRVTR